MWDTLIFRKIVSLDYPYIKTLHYSGRGAHQGGAGGWKVGGVKAGEALPVAGVPRPGALRGGQRVAAPLLQRLARRLRIATSNIACN